MFSSLRYRVVLAGASCLLLLTACNSGDSAKSGALKDAAAATVNGAPISEHLVHFMLKQRADLGRAVNAETRKFYIDRLAMQLLATQEAVKKGLDKNPEIADRLELSRQSILADAFIQDFMKTHPVSEDELKAEYEKAKAQMAGTEYKTRHILVEQEADAKDVIAKLKKNPKSFDALAKQKSKDTGSAAKGGDLGWVDPRNVVPEFGAALSKLSKGQFTNEPVKSQFGYHVIALDDSRPKQIQTFEQMKPALTQRAQQQALQKTMDDLKAKAKIEITEAPVPAPAAKADPEQPAKK